MIFIFKQFLKFEIRKIPRTTNFEKSKNFQFGNFQKFAIQKIPKIFQILQF